MSCRVLKRGVEKFVLSTIVNQAKELGVNVISAEYIPTLKNDLVRNHYLDLGFESQGSDLWHLNLKEYTERQNFISKPVL